LAATNHPEILDYALYRRFDDVIPYTLPDKQLIIKTLKSRLTAYVKNTLAWNKLAEFASGLNYGSKVTKG
jgi:AAA+ superfamily predicted ATPase